MGRKPIVRILLMLLPAALWGLLVGPGSALVAIASLTAFAFGYRFYSGFLARRIYALADDEPTPAHELSDGIDYVPANRHVLFGHHYTSIAGLAPIVGPAVAVVWGWLPALLWVVLGTIFIGGVHDFSCLVVSARNRGVSIPDLAGPVIHPRVRLLFLILVFLLTWIVIAVFGAIIAGLFVTYPYSVFPINFEIAIALLVGWVIYKLKKPLLFPSLLALAALYASIGVGMAFPEGWMEAIADFGRPIVTGMFEGVSPWVFFLLAYCFVASLLPVWLLLQPRDFINAHQLIVGLGAVYLAIFVANREMQADPIQAKAGWDSGTVRFTNSGGSDVPVPRGHPFRTPDGSRYETVREVTVPTGGTVAGTIRSADGSSDGPIRPGGLDPDAPLPDGIDMEQPSPTAGAQPWLPLLFITIACGAISGFHGLVASGTTSKQLDRMTDARPIGYGGMIGEGVLGLLSVLACTAGFADSGAWHSHYETWTDAGGKGIGAFVEGGASFLKDGVETVTRTIGADWSAGETFATFATTLIAVIVISFGATTLDSATRIQRYILAELGRGKGLRALRNRVLGSAIAAFTPILLVMGANWKKFWPVFGASNQMLAALSLLVVTVYLARKGKPVRYVFAPFLLLAAIASSSMVLTGLSAHRAGNTLVAALSALLFALSLWIIAEGAVTWRNVRRGTTGAGEIR